MDRLEKEAQVRMSFSGCLLSIHLQVTGFDWLGVLDCGREREREEEGGKDGTCPFVGSF